MKACRSVKKFFFCGLAVQEQVQTHLTCIAPVPHRFVFLFVGLFSSSSLGRLRHRGGYVIGSFLFPIRWLDRRKHVSTVHCRYELIPQTGVAVTLSASKGYE
jgi:hypothetical protein